jgi:transposase-like protein
VEMLLEQVKTSSESVAEVTRENDLNQNLLYAWIKKHSSNSARQNALVLENQRLKKDRQQLIDLIGRLTVNLD